MYLFIGDCLSLVSPFARCLSSIILILFSVSGGPFNSLPFFRWTVSVFQQLFSVSVLIRWTIFRCAEAVTASTIRLVSSSPVKPIFLRRHWSCHVPPPSLAIFFNLFTFCQIYFSLVQSRCTHYHHDACLPPIPFLLFFFLYPPVESPPLVLKLSTLGFKKVETCFEPSEVDVFSSSLLFKQYFPTSSTSLSCPSNVFLWNSISVIFFY